MNGIGIGDVADDAAWRAVCQDAWRDVVRHYASGSDDSTVADRNAGHHGDTGT